MPLPATTSSRESSLVVAVANAWQINSHSASSIDHLDQAVLQAVGEVLRIEADPAVLQRPDHLHRRSRHLRALPRSTHCTSNVANCPEKNSQLVSVVAYLVKPC